MVDIQIELFEFAPSSGRPRACTFYVWVTSKIVGEFGARVDVPKS